MNKIHKLGFAISLILTLIIIGGIVFFEGTRAVTIPVQPAFRYPADFAFSHIEWSVVLVFTLSALVLLGPWMIRFLDTDPTPRGRRGTLFPFLRRPAFDRLLTLLNVGCILVTLMFLRRLYLIPDDVAYTINMERFLCIYGTMMFMVWTVLVLVVEFSVWRAGRKLTILVALSFMGFGMPAQAQTANNDSIMQSIKDDIRLVKEKQKETRKELQAQERELRQLNKELDRARQTIQKEKQALKDAKRAGRYYEPKRLERTFQSQYREPVDAQPKEAKPVKEKPAKQKANKKASSKDEQTVQPKPVEESKESSKTIDVNAQAKTQEPKPEKVAQEPAPDAKSAPANPRRISNKEAIRLQKQRNKYYEDRLKEKKKAEKAQQKADAKKQKESSDKSDEVVDAAETDDVKAEKKAKKTKEQKEEEKKAKAEAKKAKAEEKKNEKYSKKNKNNENHEENVDDAGVDDADASL